MNYEVYKISVILISHHRMDELLENMEKQLLEIEILKSVYANQNEFNIEDEEAFCDANYFVKERQLFLLKNLGFIIKFNLNLNEENSMQVK
jgi:hypothetical protein